MGAHGISAEEPTVGVPMWKEHGMWRSKGPSVGTRHKNRRLVLEGVGLRSTSLAFSAPQLLAGSRTPYYLQRRISGSPSFSSSLGICTCCSWVLTCLLPCPSLSWLSLLSKLLSACSFSWRSPLHGPVSSHSKSAPKALDPSLKASVSSLLRLAPQIFISHKLPGDAYATGLESSMGKAFLKKKSFMWVLPPLGLFPSVQHSRYQVHVCQMNWSVKELQNGSGLVTLEVGFLHYSLESSFDSFQAGRPWKRINYCHSTGIQPQKLPSQDLLAF